MRIRLSKGDIMETTGDALTLFRSGIKSDVTRQTYERRLTEFLCGTLEDYLNGDPKLREKQRKERLAEGGSRRIGAVLDADFAQRANEIVQKARENPDEVTGMLLAYSTRLRERCERPAEDPDHFSPNSVPNMFKPIKKLFKMNGVHFQWERIDSTYPEPEANQDTRGYTRGEIATILKFANPLESAVVLLASSSGIRRGGFDFTWDCIRPVYRIDGRLVMGKYDDPEKSDAAVCGIITVYSGSSEQYFAMFTPEAWEAVRTYRTQWRASVMRSPQPKDRFLKRAGDHAKPLSCDAVANRLNKVLRRAGVRDPLKTGQRNHEVPIMNGFRRYFNKINKETLSRDSPLAALIKKEMMLSHTGLLKLDTNYFQTHWQELVEEYLDAVPALIISSEYRTRADNQRLRREKTELEAKNKELEQMKLEIQKIQQMMDVSDMFGKKPNQARTRRRPAPRGRHTPRKT